MGIKFANSAFATLASSITNSDTSITLTTGQGARFPSLSGGDYFYATLIDTSNNLEIVKCTARSTDVLTVTRAQESTTARAYSAGDRIELRITAAGIIQAVNDLVSGGSLVIPGTSSSGAILRLSEDTDNGTNYIGLKSPASVASNLDFTLPSADGTNGQFLKTDGSGNLGFQTVSVAEYQLVEAGTTSNRSLVGDSGWVTHLTVNFTTTQACTVFCHAGFAHGFEEGVVALHGRYRLDSSTTTSELQVFKQGFNINFSFGSHSLHGFFTSVSAGAHTIDLQVRNYASGTEARMNYFDNYNAGDRMFVLFK